MSTRLGWIEKAMMLIPGYRGYKKRELLREDDRLIRKYVADILREAANNLNLAREELTRRYGSQLIAIVQQPNNPVGLLERLASGLQDLARHVEHLEMGYSPSFNRLKVKEEELQRLLEIDNEMIGYANVILETSRTILDQIRQSGWFDQRLIYTVQTSMGNLSAVIARRRQFLHGAEAVKGGQLGV